MKDEEYAINTQELIVMILLLERQTECVRCGVQFKENEWLATLADFNLGQQILDRKLMKVFFGGGPREIKYRTRKLLLPLMLNIQENYPQIMGQNFESQLSELMKQHIKAS